MSLDAGGDAAINGFSIVAGDDLDINATNVTLGTGLTQDSQTASNASSGLFLEFGNGGFGFGFRSTDDAASQSAMTSVASALSAGGNLTVAADQDLTSQGAYLGAGDDLLLSAGEDIYLQAIADSYQSAENHEQTEFGIRIGVAENASGNITTLAQLPESLNAGQGGGLNKAVTAASAALKAIDAVNALQNGNLASIEASIGLSHETSSSSQIVGIANGGTLAASGDITLDAGRNITTEGTQIQAGNDISLSAGNDITLGAAQNTTSSSNDSSSAGIGLSASVGIGLNGPSASIGINVSGQIGNGSDQSLGHGNTNVLAGGDVSITSGNDTTLSGARVEADTVTADIGGDLTIESLQNTSASGSSSAGGSIGVNFNPLTGGVGGSFSLNGGAGGGTSAWVNEQSGIFAENAIDIAVGGNTDLIGGAIVSESGDLTLDTGTLTFSDLADHDRASNIRGGINLSAGLNQPGMPGWGVEGSAESRDKEQATRATIGDGEITIRDTEAQQALEDADVTADVANLNRDVDLAQEITRDEEAFIGVYVSDTAAEAAIEAGATIIDAIAASLYRINEPALSAALSAGLIDPKSALDQLINNCGVSNHASRGFSLWDLVVTPAYAQEGCTLTTISGEIIPIDDVDSCVDKLFDALYFQFIGIYGNKEVFANGLALGVVGQGEDLLALVSDPKALGEQLLAFSAEVLADPQAAGLKYGEAVVNDLQVQAYSYFKAMANGDYEEAGCIGAGLAIDIAIKIVAPAAGTGLLVVKASSPIGKIAERFTKNGGGDGAPNGTGTVEPNPGTQPGADSEAGGASYYDQYRKADGSWNYPVNLGFSGTPREATVPVACGLIGTARQMALSCRLPVRR